MENHEIRTLAQKRLKAQADFKRLLQTWLGVSVLLLATWSFTSFSVGHILYFWPAWPMLGMGIAAFFIGLDAYRGQQIVTEEAIDAEVERLPRAQGTRSA